MKRVLVSIMVMSLLLFSGAMLTQTYAAVAENNQEQFDLFLSDNVDMTVYESYSDVNFEFKDGFYQFLALYKPEDDEAFNIFLKKIMKNFSDKVSIQLDSKIVLDTDRKDFGIRAESVYKYGSDNLLVVKFASDFAKFCVGLPQITELQAGINLNELMDGVLGKSLDIKPYFEILLKDDVPENVKKRYTAILSNFIKDGNLETLDMQKVNIKGKEYKLNPYKISLDCKDIVVLAKRVLDIFTRDIEAQNYVFAKIDELFNYFIESGDYKLIGMEIDEKTLRENYNKNIVEARKDIIKEINSINLMEIYDQFEEQVDNAQYNMENKGSIENGEPTTLISTIRDCKIILTLYIDEKGYLRKYVSERDNAFVNSQISTVIYAIGDEVKEEDSILQGNIYYADVKMGEEENIIKFIKMAGGDKVFDNISNNIIAGDAVKNLIADVVKIIKSTDGLKDKDEAINMLENFVDMAKGQVEKMKMQYLQLNN